MQDQQIAFPRAADADTSLAAHEGLYVSAYSTPKLTRFGSVSALTAGGSSSQTSEFFNGCKAQAFLFRC